MKLSFTIDSYLGKWWLKRFPGSNKLITNHLYIKKKSKNFKYIMYITITNDKTMKSTPSWGFPGEDTGEKKTESR